MGKKKKVLYGESRELKGPELLEFQKITAMLVEYDERTGRHTRYRDAHTHYMRKSFSVAGALSARVWVAPLGDEALVYQVTAVVSSAGVYMAQTWVHEDGIAQERQNADSGNAIHGIVCVTDLYRKSAACEIDAMAASLCGGVPK